MDAPMGLGEFLRTRRARLRPEDVGLVSYGARRRVPGLRREELARLAGVSAAYYTRLEQGQSNNASAAVLDALAHALQLSDDEHAHLRNLARPSRTGRRPPERPACARPGTRQLIGAMGTVPAIVLDRRSDILAWNPAGHALIAGHLDFAAPDSHCDRPNLQRLLFLDPHTRELYPRWEEEAKRAVSSLRLMAGRYSDDRRFAELIGELLLKSPEFATLWQRHPVHNCVCGTKSFHHPLVGPLDLSFESLHMPDDSGQWILMYSAEAGSPSDSALRLLLDFLAPPSADPVPAHATEPLR
ncbi:helix-turn-helix transcriptional regulator [Actinacidiphila acididurans]|uniref:Helix-turn-helix domain-containing protein n=1 Tax=Actinacidiphila acididurans TaxID=2784346 RepID=A0ABS2TL52_9ACTN|nr:helix-turn-helix transcriptional regulator [Actinacidiphila acididurans]MBM9504064.1 helix-turn-helix domain-containing protein [Actinacidiphila acididurans]